MRIVFKREEDNGVTVVIPAKKSDLEKVLGPLTDEQYKAHIYERSVPNGAECIEMDAVNLPDREFRNAWCLKDSKLDHDLAKAKDIQLEKIRIARAPKFTQLDSDFMYAIEKNDNVKKDKVVSDKQKMRDITEPLKAMNPASLDEIRNAFPEELKD